MAQSHGICKPAHPHKHYAAHPQNHFAARPKKEYKIQTSQRITCVTVGRYYATIKPDESRLFCLDRALIMLGQISGLH